MKLIKLKINNFRGLKGENNIIEFDGNDLIFLIGKNNIGKSTFLKSYQYISNSKQLAQIDDFYNRDESIPIEIEGFFKLEGLVDEETLDSNGWIEKWVDSEKILRVKKEWTQAGEKFKKYTYNPSSEEYELNGFGGMDTLFTSSIPQPIEIGAIETIESLEKQINDILKKENLKNLKENHSKLYNETNETFTKLFPELEIKINSKQSNGFDISKILEKNHSMDVKNISSTHQFNMSNSGTRIIRQILFDFLKTIKSKEGNGRKNYIILYEEPELYLHPKVIRLLREELYEIVKDSPFQIICATHSPQMIDISKQHTSLVRITKTITLETETTQVGSSLFLNDENKAFVQMLNRFDPNICEVFYADEVIIVAGNTEAIVCRELLREHFPQKDIFVLNSGSKNNIPFFQDVLNHFKIKQHIIFDSDTRYLYEKDGVTRKKTKHGSDKKNSAWTLNRTILTKIRENKQLSKGYLSIYNFESSHDYEYDSKKGKPLSAYEYAKGLGINSNSPIVKKIKQIAGVSVYDEEITIYNYERIIQEPSEKIALRIIRMIRRWGNTPIKIARNRRKFNSKIVDGNI